MAIFHYCRWIIGFITFFLVAVSIFKLAHSYWRYSKLLSGKPEPESFLSEWEKQRWYHVEAGEVEGSSKDVTITKEYVMSKFVQLSADEETKNFIVQSAYKSGHIWTQMWQDFAYHALKRFLGYTLTDIFGYLRRQSSFVLSTQQFILLREKAGLPSNLDEPEGFLIDLGAGNGDPTQYLQPLYNDTFATEASWAMRDILEEKSIKVLDMDLWDRDGNHPRYFDAISCLNLLDRCEKPKSILRQIQKSLKPGGVLLIALVLPFEPFVECNYCSHKPVEDLMDTSKPYLAQEKWYPNYPFFEKEISSVIEVLEVEGFSVDAWTRVPYLMEGNMGTKYFEPEDKYLYLHNQLFNLDDAILLCTLKQKTQKTMNAPNEANSNSTFIQKESAKKVHQRPEENRKSEL